MPYTIVEERTRRSELWHTLISEGGPNGVTPGLVRRLGIHRGEQGIFRDQTRTQALGYPSGVAVGLRHTGRVYPDDLNDRGLVYHYPATVRGRRDNNEILSIKLCRELHLPLFVTITPFTRAKTRDVKLGWVQNWNDENASIFIQFSDDEAEPQYIDTSELDEAGFQLRQERRSRRTLAPVRPNQVQFRFDVLKRYGTCCAVCEIRHPRLLHAAHLCPFQSGGSDDARNGLVFCLNHHQAFDSGLFRIDPHTLNVVTAAINIRAELGIVRRSISHLSKLPHPDALAWAFGANTSEKEASGALGGAGAEGADFSQAAA